MTLFSLNSVLGPSQFILIVLIAHSAVRQSNMGDLLAH